MLLLIYYIINKLKCIPSLNSLSVFDDSLYSEKWIDDKEVFEDCSLRA